MKISVIIPVYNVEKYLRQCLDSVINQTYTNLEIICVNDCSTDSSLEILEEYAKKDSRIIIINNETNCGLGLTRNHGYEYATGEYIHFLDSDDWIEQGLYEKLADVIAKNGDIDVTYFFKRMYSEQTGEFQSDNLLQDNTANKLIHIDDDFRATMVWKESVWCKLYLKSFLDDMKIIHNDYRCHEDMEFSFLVRFFARTIYYLNEYLINYRINRKDSLMWNRFLYNDCVYKSFVSAYNLCKTLENQTLKKKLLRYEGNIFYNHSRGAYLSKCITYKELGSIYKKMHIDEYSEYIYSLDLLDIYEVTHYPEWLYKFLKYTRKFFKTNCLCLYEFLVKLRNKKDMVEKLYNDRKI